MTTWSNWSGRETCEPAQLRFVRSVDELGAVVATAAETGRRVRVAGSGHSHSPLVPTSDVIVDVSGLSGVVAVDAAAGTARVWAGTTISALGRPLHDAGVALANQGDIDRQTIAGAVATGTHGTGRTLRNLSASVLGLTLVTATGDTVTYDAAHDPHLFEAARLGLGAFGVVTQIDLAVRPAYRLAERSWRAPYDELRGEVDEHVRRHRHFEFFWYPGRDVAVAKAIDETDAAPEYPLADEGGRIGWNYEVLPNHRPHLHTEIEVAVPLERSLDCLDELRHLIRSRFADLRWPIEYRTLAADDVWLSQAYERDVATISVHQGVDVSDVALFTACEAVFRRYDARAHWGKVHFSTGADLAAAHPRWADWWERRDVADPGGVFLNDALRAWR
ncbi:MAG TPA: D-arabinono-1,4-lactone oxidase [Ilumatobacter sp.]